MKWNESDKSQYKINVANDSWVIGIKELRKSAKKGNDWCHSYISK